MCGRIRAYQVEVQDSLRNGGQVAIHDAYFSCVAVMHSSPRHQYLDLLMEHERMALLSEHQTVHVMQQVAYLPSFVR